jgi:hypothetical protein
MNEKLNKIKIFLLCPIPDEQKPINEYINFRISLNNYFKKQDLFKYYLSDQIKNDLNLYTLTIFNQFQMFLTDKKQLNFTFKTKSLIYQEFKKVDQNFVNFFKIKQFFEFLKNCFPFWFLFWSIRLIDLENRFHQSKLIYEETSWYDGQIWEKPFFSIKNDRFLSLLIIQPILKKNFLILIVFCHFLFFYCFNSYY